MQRCIKMNRMWILLDAYFLRRKWLSCSQPFPSEWLKFHPYFSCFYFILYDTEILVSYQNKKLFTVLVKYFLTPCIFTSIDFQVINVFSSTVCLYFEEFTCVLCLHPLPHPFPSSTPPASQLPLMSSLSLIFNFILCVYVYAQIYIQASGYI